MNIGFGQYPLYSDTISEFFETYGNAYTFGVNMLMIILQANRKFAHGLTRRIGKF